MKAFISHASPDKPTVRRIARELEIYGCSVWLDEADIRVGDSIPEKVSEGLATSDALILAYSTAATKSRWVARELYAFFMSAMRSGKLILPCKLDDAAAPQILADIKYADFSDSFSAGMDGLILSIEQAFGTQNEQSRYGASPGKARQIAMSLRNQINPHERARCYRTWVVADGLSANIFAGFDPEVLAVVTALEDHGLIQDLDDLGDRDWHYVATPLGLRVFQIWHDEDEA